MAWIFLSSGVLVEVFLVVLQRVVSNFGSVVGDVGISFLFESFLGVGRWVTWLFSALVVMSPGLFK